MAKKQRKHNYVVGFLNEGSCIYGKAYGQAIRNDWTIANPMTLWQATSMLNDLHTYPKAIFKLVPVAIIDKPKKKPKRKR